MGQGKTNSVRRLYDQKQAHRHSTVFLISYTCIKTLIKGFFKGRFTLTTRFLRVWKGILGTRDKSNIQCGILENAKCFDGIRDLTVTRKARFAKILEREADLGKETVFGVEMTEVRDAGLSWKRIGNAGSGTPLPDSDLSPRFICLLSKPVEHKSFSKHKKTGLIYFLFWPSF